MVMMLLFFAMIISRALYLQVFHRQDLISYSKGQFLRTAELYPLRGQILDRNGSPLAINIQKFDLFAMPQYLQNLNSVQVACNILNINCSAIKKNIHERKKFTWIGRDLRLTERQIAKLKNLDGIFLEDKFSRFYPNKELLAPVLGFTNIDNKGLAGIEYIYDQELKGMPKFVKYVRDAKGRPMKFESIQFHGKGSDISLSIDRDVQLMVEKFLKDGVELNRAKSGGAAVLDPSTGEILAIANYPSFDPNKYQDAKPAQRKLPFITDPFEPGSVFKVLTVAAAMEMKNISPLKKYYCEKGSYRIGKHIVQDAANHKFEWLSMADILKESSNIGTTKIAFDIGFEKFNEFLLRAKIGKKTGIELGGESNGIYIQKNKSGLIQLSNLSFGQGVATTALQILSLYGAIANNGNWIKPTILKVDDPGKIKPERIMNSKTIKNLEIMLKDVVDEGTASNAKLPHYEIAGKTSTAQKVGTDGKYSGIISGFIGYPLHQNKKYVVYVYIDEPQAKFYGNEVAAPIFKDIMSFLIYRSQDLQPVISKNEEELPRDLRDELKMVQSSTTKAKIETKKDIFSFENGVIPNFIGMDKMSVAEIAEKGGLQIDARGVGLVVSQTPAAGEALTKDTKIKLIFKIPTL